MDKAQIKAGLEKRRGSNWKKVLNIINRTPNGVTTSDRFGPSYDEGETDSSTFPDTPPPAPHTPGA